MSDTSAPPRQPAHQGDPSPGKRWRAALLFAGPALAISLLLMVLWGFVAWFVWVYPRELIAVQQRDLIVTSRAAAAQTSTVLREGETAMRMVALWLTNERRRGVPEADTLKEIGQILQGTARDLVEVGLVRRNGEVIRFGDKPDQQRINVKDADFFRRLMQDAEAGTGAVASGLFVGLPLQLSPGGPRVLPLAMRLPEPVGNLGLVIALLSLERFDSLQKNFAHEPSAAVMLLRADGTGLARTPAMPGFAGRNAFLVQAAKPEAFAARAGTFSSNGQFTDGRDRIGAYQSLPAFGLKVVVSVAEEDSLAAHFRERRFLLMLIGIVSLSALGAALALARSQRRALLHDAELLAASDAAPMGLFRCDLNGRVTYANETYLQLHGLRREDQAWGWLDLLPEEEREHSYVRWAGRMLSDKPAVYVRHMRHGRDRKMRLMSIRTAPLIVQGRVVGQSGTLEDITERAAHQKAQATLTAIFDLTPDYISQMTLDGQLTYLNPSARKRLGIALDTPLDASYNYRRYYTPGRLDRLHSEILPAAMRQGHWSGRSGVLDPGTGLEVPVDSTVLVHRNERGEVEMLSMLLRDVSAEVQARREGRRFEAMLLAIAQTAPVMIAVLDTRQCYLFLNDLLALHMGATREAWLGRHARELLGEAGYARSQPLIEAALRGEVGSIEKHLDNGAGSALIIEVQYAPLQLEGGEIEGVISTSRDVTEARRETQHLREASQTDPLTQLLNRAGFALGCETLVAKARERNTSLCLLYLDLDRFKPVNDEHGHPVGDALLKAVAGRLRHALRPQDLVARLGGDEFAVLLPSLAQAGGAPAVAAKLVQLIAMPFKIDTLTLNIGVSIGFCIASGEQADIEAMVALADARLYDAKRGGRGRFQGGVLGDL